MKKSNCLPENARQKWDSNPRMHCTLAQQANALTTRPSCHCSANVTFVEEKQIIDNTYHVTTLVHVQTLRSFSGLIALVFIVHQLTSRDTLYNFLIPNSVEKISPSNGILFQTKRRKRIDGTDRHDLILTIDQVGGNQIIFFHSLLSMAVKMRSCLSIPSM